MLKILHIPPSIPTALIYKFPSKSEVLPGLRMGKGHIAAG
jgi:hypothetical protein